MFPLTTLINFHNLTTPPAGLNFLYLNNLQMSVAMLAEQSMEEMMAILNGVSNLFLEPWNF